MVELLSVCDYALSHCDNPSLAHSWEGDNGSGALTMSTQALERGLDCLLALANSDGPLSVGEIAAATGIPSSTVYRLLRPLEKRGLIERTERGKRLLGLQVLVLCRSARNVHRLQVAEIALPIMQELARSTQETVILTAVKGLEAICVEAVPSPQLIRLTPEKGRPQPIWAGCSSKILLAHMNEDYQEQVTNLADGRRYYNGVVITRGAMARELDHIRQNGFCVTIEEVDPEAAGVAAPILGRWNMLEAGLSVLGPKYRFQEDRLPRIIELVVSSARSISESVAFVAEPY